MALQPVLFYEVPDAIETVKRHTNSVTAKQLGAYYTDCQIADRLSAWAIRAPSDTVVDPSFGGGVFLRAAGRRLQALEGDPALQVYGVEIDPEVRDKIGKKLGEEFGIPLSSLVRSDFFELPVGRFQVDAVVGNPPFIRFHRFAGKERDLALTRAMESGVRLTKLTSSWAPFLVHALSLLKRGGRLAMVVPAELAYAAYAAPVMKHIRARFANVSLLSFREKLFRDLNEDTFLLLADGFGCPHVGSVLFDYETGGSFRVEDQQPVNECSRSEIDLNELAEGRNRLVEQFLPSRARDLYRRLKGEDAVAKMGRLADVGIGYVTGANDFFHLSPSEVARWSIPESVLRKAVVRGRALRGSLLTDQDWEKGLEVGDARYLFATNAAAPDLPSEVRSYLDRGLAQGVADGFKCRNRMPWYSVPHVREPDAILTYMSGRRPKLAANVMRAVVPNTLHVLHLKPKKATLPSVLIGWNSSLTRLSVEIEGHALGGGMLKVEPTEAERICLPLNLALGEHEVRHVDALIRCGMEQEARRFADEMTLIGRLGLSRADCELLYQGAEELSSRRSAKSKGA